MALSFAQRRIHLPVFAIATLCIALSALDSYAVNSLLFALVGELGGTEVGVVAFAYAVVATIAALFAGAAVDRRGALWTLIASLTLFGLGAAMCAAAPSMFWLAVGRAVQGGGGGALTVGAIAMLTVRVEPAARVRYLSNLGVLFAVCSVLGPAAAALIHEAWSWRAFFGIQIPMVAAAIAWLRWQVAREPPDDGGNKRPFGAKSAVRLAALIGLSVFWLHFAPTSGHLGGLQFYGSTLALALLAWAVIRAERRDSASLFPSALFHSGPFRLTNVLLLCSALTTLGLAAMVPFYLQAAAGANVAEGGLSASPIVFGTMTGSLIVGRVAGRTSPRVVVALGFLASLTGYGLLGLAHYQFSLLLVLTGVFLTGAGYGAVMPQLTSRAQGLVEKQEHGSATALASVSRSYGSVVGVAVFGALVFPGEVRDVGGSADSVREAFQTVVWIGAALLCACVVLSALRINAGGATRAS